MVPSDLPVADTKFVVDYYRLTPDGRLLFGGGENYTPRYPRDLKAFVAKPVHRVFPQLRDVTFDYAWGGPVGVTLSRLPHFGHAGARTVFAHGFSGQGVALATLAGQVLPGRVEDLRGDLGAGSVPGGAGDGRGRGHGTSVPQDESSGKEREHCS